MTARSYLQLEAPLPLRSLWRQGPEQASAPAASDRRPEIHTVRTEQRAAARQFSTDRTPAPVISIGKIEVQFLPQESRAPAARPQPERTRGFAGYARARRGEPR